MNKNMFENIEKIVNMDGQVYIHYIDGRNKIMDEEDYRYIEQCERQLCFLNELVDKLKEENGILKENIKRDNIIEKIWQTINQSEDKTHNKFIGNADNEKQDKGMHEGSQKKILKGLLENHQIKRGETFSIIENEDDQDK